MYWEPRKVWTAVNTAALFFLLTAAAAPGQTVSVRGAIEDYPARGRMRLEVQLNSPEITGAARAEVMPDGTFELDFVEPGNYQLLVLGGRNGILHQEPVTVAGEAVHLSIRLNLPESGQPVAGTISARALSRHIPAAAVKEGNRSLKAIAKGDLESAVVHLRKAIEIYPDYPAAHNNLGVCYDKLNQHEEALSELQRAAELDSGSAHYAVNLSTELLFHNKYSDAELAARHALQLDPSSEQAHYVLGASLAAQRESNHEALRQLELAVTRVPEALIVAADVLARMGRRAEAAANLRKYLGLAGNRVGRQIAETWLRTLQ